MKLINSKLANSVHLTFAGHLYCILTNSIIYIYYLRRKRYNIVFKEKYTFTDTELTTHRPACVHVVPGNVLLP